jgi:hypothetical protein
MLTASTIVLVTKELNKCETSGNIYDTTLRNVLEGFHIYRTITYRCTHFILVTSPLILRKGLN